MDLTPRELTDLIASAPSAVMVKALCPEYAGDRFQCPTCQTPRWREALPPRVRACGSERESFERAVTAGPRAWFVDADRWRCHECGAAGLRSEVERMVRSDPGACARFLVLAEGLLNAA